MKKFILIICMCLIYSGVYAGYGGGNQINHSSGTIDELTVSSVTAKTAAGIDVNDDIRMQGNLDMVRYLRHIEDTDTNIEFLDDRIRLRVGNQLLMDFREASQDFIDLGLGADVDVLIGNGAFYEGSSSIIYISSQSEMGAANHVNGVGDLYVADDLEVDGFTCLQSTMHVVCTDDDTIKFYVDCSSSYFNVPIYVSTINTTLAELYIETNTYTLGYASAAYFYGNGANVTDIVITNIDAFTEAELETQTSDVTNWIQEDEINTAAELEVIVADYNLIVSSEIDTFSEINTIVSDKTLINEEDAVTFDSAITHTAASVHNGGIDINEDVDIDFDAQDEEFNITSSTGLADDNALCTIYSTSGSYVNNNYLLRLRYADDGDAEADFLVCEDNDGDDKLSVDFNGDIYSAGDINLDGTLSVTEITSQAGDTEITISSSIAISGFCQLQSKTAAELQTSTPTAVGQMYWNSDVDKMFISTGTINAGSYAASDDYTDGPY